MGYPWGAGEVLQASDLNSAILNAPGRVASVAGHVGTVTLTHSDSTDWASATSGFTYTLPTASTVTLGGVKVDGSTITIAGGIISAVAATQNWTAAAVSAIGSTLTNSGGTLSVTADSYAATVSAAGTTQGTATALTSDTNVVTTVGANSGVILASGRTKPQRVLNRGANALKVYPQTSAQIEALGSNAAATVNVGQAVTFLPVSSTQWYAA
jgi:hypothetical protein